MSTTYLTVDDSNGAVGTYSIQISDKYVWTDGIGLAIGAIIQIKAHKDKPAGIFK